MSNLEFNQRADPEIDRWVEMAQVGNEEALAKLVEASRPGLLRFLNRLTRNKDLADDLVQDTAVKAVRNLANFEPQNFYGWLTRIAFRTFVDERRRARTRNETGLPDWFEGKIGELSGNAAGDPLTPEFRITVGKCIDGLTPEQQALIGMHYGQGFSLMEVSEIVLGETGSNPAHHKIEAALIALRKCLGFRGGAISRGVREH